MRWPAGGVLIVLALTLSRGALASDPAPGTVTLRLKGGSRVVGVIVKEDPDQVTVMTTAGVEMQLPREAIVSMSREAGPEERSDPNATRLMFAPTARSLPKGDGYFSDHYVLFPGFSYGLTEHVSLSGGMSVVPFVGFEDQLFYASTRAGWQVSKRASVSVGGLVAGGLDGFGAGILFGVGTFGSTDASLTAGIGFGAAREDASLPYEHSRRRWAVREAPVLMIGGSRRLSDHVAVLSESWIVTGRSFHLSEQPFGVALRFFGDRLSADVGFILVGEALEEGFPVPWLSFTYQFGPSARVRR
jgi:hypothetical protein